MNKKTFVQFSFFCSMLFACQSPPSTPQSAPLLPSTPEAICRQWQTFLDNNEIDKALSLGTPQTKKWLLDNRDLLIEEGPIEATQFISMSCTESDNNAVCKYTLREDGDLIEDFFTLLLSDQQWLIHIEETASTDADALIFEKMKQTLNL